MNRFELFLIVAIFVLAPFTLLAQSDTTKSAVVRDSLTVGATVDFNFTPLVLPVVDSLPLKKDTSYYRLNAKYLTSYIIDFPRLLTTPLRFTNRDWTKLAVITVIGGALSLVDRPVYDLMNSNHTHLQTQVATVVQPSGNIYPPLFIGGMYMIGVMSHNRKMEHSSLMTAKALVFSTIIYSGVKKIVRRMRPAYTDYPYHFQTPFTGGGEFTSFPSGHTNTIFTVATALAIEYKHIPWVPPVAYSIAGLTGISRLYDNKHWASDVWFGAVCGYFITKGLYKIEQEKAKLTRLKEVRF